MVCWLAALIALNLQTSFLIQAVALVLLFLVPGIATWLPEAIGW